jgi:hypothetical protein
MEPDYKDNKFWLHFGSFWAAIPAIATRTWRPASQALKHAALSGLQAGRRFVLVHITTYLIY